MKNRNEIHENLISNVLFDDLWSLFLFWFQLKIFYQLFVLNCKNCFSPNTTVDGPVKKIQFVKELKLILVDKNNV